MQSVPAIQLWPMTQLITPDIKIDYALLLALVLAFARAAGGRGGGRRKEEKGAAESRDIV